MDKVMFHELNIGNIKIKVVDLSFVICLFVFSFLIRWKLMPIESADFWGFLEDWMLQIRAGGGFKSLDHQISNYTSPYMYLMCLVSYLTENNLYGLKMISVVFDYLAAAAVFLIVYQLTGNARRSIMGMAALLLCPTVILDGAYWCQCDIIYTTFLLFALYYFFKDNSRLCLIFVGISFAFKLQALFLVPFFIIMWLKRKTIRIVDFLWIPVVYVISALPAWGFGRDFKELLGIYFDQAQSYPWGTLEYPNIYALLGEAMPDMRHAGEVSSAGTYMTIILLGCIAYYFYVKRINLTGEIMITLALFTTAIIVYSLPHMHERYGFLVDLLAIIYGMLNRKKLPVACGFMLVSVLSFMPYLIAVHIVPIQYVAIGLLGLILYIGYDLYRQVQENSTMYL
jgi:Gpi18-like mannosyltransferase